MPLASTTSALRRLVYDTASLGPRAVELAVKVIGADRIMFGTDYPIFPPANPRELLGAADISAADRSLIASGTASALLSRLGIGSAGPAVQR
jgi:predicted TIM-barrel fold metal-dependent hydrolase